MSRWAWAGLSLAVVACTVLIGIAVSFGNLTSEYWCGDRSPWWGPPQDRNSTCTGHAWAADHPGDFPWTMPR